MLFEDSKTLQYSIQVKPAYSAFRTDSHVIYEVRNLLVKFAEHNLPFVVGDHFACLTKVMFPDCKIAELFSCARTDY